MANQDVGMSVEVRKLREELRTKGLEKRIATICQEHDIVFIAVFGSFVRGEQKERSDVDIAIEFDKGKPKSLFDLLHVEEKLSKILKRKVDLGVLSSLSPYVADDVRKEMQVIYEKG